MTCKVVCVSRTLGAGGEEVARLVAEQLGFRYVDDEIIGRAASAAGVSPEVVEQAEHTPPLVARIMEALAAAPVPSVGEVVVLPAQRSVNYAQLIELVIREVAGEGNVVIVAHGASIPLAGVDDVLRVLVTASPHARAGRLAERDGLDMKAAEKSVDASDRERAQFLKRFYDVGEEDAIHYDLTINTDALNPARAAGLVVHAASE